MQYLCKKSAYYFNINNRYLPSAAFDALKYIFCSASHQRQYECGALIPIHTLYNVDTHNMSAVLRNPLAQ